MILSAQTIRELCNPKVHDPQWKTAPALVTPFYEQTIVNGMTFGLGPAGYDVRIREHVVIAPGGFVLASVIERMHLPLNIMGWIADKSSWARKGIAVQNSVADPGWQGHLTLEITNHSTATIEIAAGMPMAHVVFMWLDYSTELPYVGKYQDQPPVPTPAIHEVKED